MNTVVAIPAISQAANIPGIISKLRLKIIIDNEWALSKTKSFLPALSGIYDIQKNQKYNKLVDPHA